MRPRRSPLRFLRLAGAAALGCALRAAAQPPSPPPVVLPQVEVRAQPPAQRLFQDFEKINHAFDGAFPSLASGELVEAILWRHRFLADHPQEDALIVIDQVGRKVSAATTVYSLGGAVYGSSNILGEHLLLPGLTPAALRRPEAVAQARRAIQQATAAYRANGSPDIGPPTLGAAIAAGQATGDYQKLGDLAGSAAPLNSAGALGTPGVPGAKPALMPADMDPGEAARMRVDDGLGGGISVARAHSTQALADGLIMPFNQPKGETLAWTYSVLRDPAQAGLLPVALTAVQLGAGKAEETLVFDWEGTQYYYRPGLGAVAVPLPLDPLVGEPFLCVKGGEFLEAVCFSALYARQHPGQPGPVLLVDHPSLVGYADGDKLGLFIPAVGSFSLPADFQKALGDEEDLAQVRQDLISQIQPGPQAGALPEGLPGDTAELQIRRAYLAFQAAGIPSQFIAGEHPSFRFDWQGVKFSYGEDQKVRVVSGL